MRSQVTGLSSVKHSLTPACLRTYAIASLIAKATDAPRNNGGSPTACMYFIQKLLQAIAILIINTCIKIACYFGMVSYIAKAISSL